MRHREHMKPVRHGTWLYAGCVPCEVRIVPHDMLYGSGDDEDAPEIAADQKVPCCYVLFHTPTGSPPWVSGGAALTVTEAVEIAEAKLGTGLVWHNDG